MKNNLACLVKLIKIMCGEHNFNPSLNEYPPSELEKMKGDAIGSTLYSECWVLRMLIKITEFTEEQWCDEFESDLCALWDMTLEKDVIDLLMKHEVLSIITNALCGERNERFTEILLGIVANMCCDKNVRQVLSEKVETVAILTALLDESDPPILIQLIRVMHAVAWDIVQESDFSPKWLEDAITNSLLAPYFSFILKSSTNEDLLTCVLEFLNTICTIEISDKDFSQYFATSEMISGMIDAWQQLLGCWTYEEGFPNKQLEKTAAHWCGILLSFSGHESGKAILSEYSDQIGCVCFKIMNRPHENLDGISIISVNLLDSLLPSYFNGNLLKILLLVLNLLYQSQGEVSELNGENLEPILQDTIENYCANVSISVDREILNSLLSECSENHVLLFWKAVSERKIDDMGERAI
ncbi:uncharacterized protein LOC106668168 isoform X2 [Cimex lectularius]|uniref:Protein SAAL1 n=1 Tax=Cimex lectularius TaxID=79782 RepID=A0A8I6RWM7_CIMLE|nr:uncharacterized protein LOC106668168 isoform X2 [Cimex lectularius]